MKDKRHFRLNLRTRLYHFSRRIFVNVTVRGMALRLLYPLSFWRKRRLTKDVEVYSHPLSATAYNFFATGQPGNPELCHFAGILRSDDRLLEVGSHFGVFTLMAAKLLGPEDVAGIDCSPIAHLISKLNASANRISPGIFHYAALSDETLETRVSLGNFYMAGLDKSGDFAVQALTGDAWCQRQSFAPSVVKIDVEGHEEKVIRGLADTLGRTRLVLLEVHDFLLSAEEIARVFQLLNEVGLTVHRSLSPNIQSQQGTTLWEATRLPLPGPPPTP